MAKNQTGGRLSGNGKPGGGMGSRATNAPTSYFTGIPSTRISPKGVSQIGSSMGNHSMDNGGKPLTRSVEPVRTGAVGGSVRLGNETAIQAGQGPGAGRSVSRCGSQQGVSPSTPIGP